MALEELWIELGHYNKDGIEVVDVEGEIECVHGASAP